jgi:DNA polymerase-3 subunit delta'
MNMPWLESTWQAFTTRGLGDRMAQVLLVTGAPGLGKLQLAEHMARWLLCLQPGEQPCGNCRSCKLLKPEAGFAHPERFEMTLGLLDSGAPAKEIKVSQVRELMARLSLTTTISPRKVALVFPAERLNRNAANALLKTLEEPPGNAVIILVSDDASRLPATVRSRCQALSVPAPGSEQALQWLLQQVDTTSKQASLAMEMSGHSPLAALRILQTGATGQFAQLRKHLWLVRARPERLAGASADMTAVDPELTWLWLSRCAASALVAALAGEGVWHDPAMQPDIGRLASLQARADVNRRLVETTVRQDLLLLEWLLEWAALHTPRAAPTPGAG